MVLFLYSCSAGEEIPPSMMSTEQMQPLELSEDRLDKLDPHCDPLGKCSRVNVSSGSQKGDVSVILLPFGLQASQRETPRNLIVCAFW